METGRKLIFDFQGSMLADKHRNMEVFVWRQGKSILRMQ